MGLAYYLCTGEPQFDFNCIFIFYFIHQIRDKADKNANIDDAKGHHFNDEFH